MKTRIILNFIIAFTTSTLLFGQTKFEDKYKALSDRFLVKTLGKVKFEKYYRFNKIWWYSLNGDIMTVPKSLNDSSVTHVMSSYWITIDELKLRHTIDICYDKKNNTHSFKDIELIPDFVCKRVESTYLDTLKLKKILIDKGVKRELIRMGVFNYYEVKEKFAWGVIELVVPYNPQTKREVINLYVLDAKTGEIIDEQRNLAHNPYPGFRGVR